MDNLYKLAFEYKQNKLWKKLFDDDLFAVALPDGEIGYCSVMGHIGEYNSLAVYVGERGLNTYYDIYASYDENDDEYDNADMMGLTATQECLQCSFGNKDETADDIIKEVRDYAKRNGISLRGKNSFPSFLKYQPYCMPWKISDEKDLEIIETVLRAAIDVAQMLEYSAPEELGFEDYRYSDPMIYSDNVFDCHRSVPLLTPKGDEFSWSEVKLPEHTKKTYPVHEFTDEALIAKICKLKKSGSFESKVVPIPYPVQENPEEAPFFPATIVAVNVRSHKILHTDDAQMHDYEGLDKLLNGLVRGFIDIGVCPKSITVCDNESHALLSDFCEKCKIMLVKARSFKILDGIVSDFYDNLDDEHDMDSGEINAEMLASITNTLMEMPDDVLRTMPNDLVQLIFSLIEDGVVSPELTQKFRRVFGLFS